MSPRPRSERRCSAPSCDRRHLARGFCKKHYQRWVKHGHTGDPPSPDLPNEEWRPVPGFPNYEASNLGRVKNAHGMHAGRVLNPMTNRGKTYQIVKLFGRDGNKVTWRRMFVHRVVMAAFVGPDASKQVNHIDGNPANNALSNLEYATAHENMRHAVETGLYPCQVGESNRASKTTDEQVREMRAMRARGMLQKDIASKFGITRSNVSYILSGHTWGHVGDTR